MYADERRTAITAEVAGRTRVSVADLAERFAVTTETIRRDLAELQRAGAVRRVHGGAVRPSALPGPESDLQARGRKMIAEKRRIAAAAAGLLPPDGGAVILDAGTTVGAMCDHWPADRTLTAVTNSLPVAAALSMRGGGPVHIVGGRVRGLTQAAVGAATVAELSAVVVDVAFLGTNAVSAEHGLTTPDADEAAVKRAMCARAGQTVVLADSSKLGHDVLHRFAATDSVDVLITDDAADPTQVARLRAAGIEVVLA